MSKAADEAHAAWMYDEMENLRKRLEFAEMLLDATSTSINQVPWRQAWADLCCLRESRPELVPEPPSERIEHG